MERIDGVVYSKAKKHLKRLLRQVNQDHSKILITSKDKNKNAVLMSKLDFDNLMENYYLNKESANVEAILKSWASLKSGEV